MALALIPIEMKTAGKFIAGFSLMLGSILSAQESVREQTSQIISEALKSNTPVAQHIPTIIHPPIVGDSNKHQLPGDTVVLPNYVVREQKFREVKLNLDAISADRARAVADTHFSDLDLLLNSGKLGSLLGNNSVEQRLRDANQCIEVLDLKSILTLSLSAATSEEERKGIADSLKLLEAVK